MERYEIVVSGLILKSRSRALADMDIEHRGGMTVLVGSLIDQTELHSVLNHIRDMAVPLISLRRINSANSSPNID